MIDGFVNLLLPTVLSVSAAGFLMNKGSFKVFTEGAYDGMKSCTELLPTLLLIMCSVNAMMSSGLSDIVCKMFEPLMSTLKIPEEMIPLVVVRPFSGSGGVALADKLFSHSGADSVPSKIACLLMGSTDTLFYTLGMYVSSVNVKRTRYSLAASLIVFVFSVVLCAFVGNILYA